MALVPPPPIRPPRLSLVNAAPTTDAEVEGQRWELGYEFAPDACRGGWIEDPCAVGNRSSKVTGRPGTIEVEPFNVVTGDECSTFGWTAENYEERARALLARCTSKQIAAELWSGELAQAAGWPNQFFTDALMSDTVTSAATDVVTVLACLESALAGCGCGEQGMIHATRQLVTHWDAASLLRREGGQILTVHDTIVVADAGYDGSGPGDVPAGNSQWAFATGMIEIRLGEVQVYPRTLAEAVDRTVNDVRYFAQRAASAAFDGCCLFAAEAALAVCAVGGVS